MDSIINVDEYVAKKIARALAKALDTAIAKGEGSTKKQPEGILPKLSASHKVTVTADNNLLKNLVKQIGLIDSSTLMMLSCIRKLSTKTTLPTL